jgi:hypothetical protein
MASIKITGGDLLAKKLGEISKKVASAHQVSVGFMADAKYPDGTQVAMVAAIHNFGAPAAGIPPRPFFTRMIEEHKAEWGPKLGHAIKNLGWDARQALAAVGEDIAGDLRESILNGNWQGLSEITLMLRTMRSQDRTLKVTGKTVGQAADLIAAGGKHKQTKTGSTPLVDTGYMLNSITYAVDDGDEQK